MWRAWGEICLWQVRIIQMEVEWAGEGGGCVHQCCQCRWVKPKQLQGHNESADTVSWYSLLTHAHGEHDFGVLQELTLLSIYITLEHTGSLLWPMTTRRTRCTSHRSVLTWPEAHSAGQPAATPPKVSPDDRTPGRDTQEARKVSRYLRTRSAVIRLSECWSLIPCLISAGHSFLFVNKDKEIIKCV